MPNAATTQASFYAGTSGTPIPLSYGYAWATGKRHAYYQIQDTYNHDLDYTRAGIWLLGHGEWDGPEALFINDKLAWRGNTAIDATWLGWDWIKALDYPKQDIVFHYHSGVDATIGAGLTPVSTGGDQGVDKLWSVFPPAIQPFAFSRIAYYALMRKQPIENQTNDHADDPSQWTDINPIGVWRALKCRLFNASGVMTGYAFTTNPVWHWVDVRLRRKLFVEYNISAATGPDDLSAAVRACFDWNKIFTSAQYCDEILANGRRRFQHSNSFTSKSTLQAIESAIAQTCRGYFSTYGGKYALNIDMPRPSVFMFSRNNVLPGSFNADEQQSHTAANRYIGQFRDLLVPKAATIASIVNVSNGNPILTTVEPHPFAAEDFVAIGGTDSIYDGEWQVDSVPDIINPGTPEEIDPSTLTLRRKGSNYPDSIGSGGAIGLLYARFANRTPLFRHKANELARGAIAVGVSRQRNAQKTTIEMGVASYDQTNRITRYERDRRLGSDPTGTNGKLTAAYVLPKFVKLSTALFADDVHGNLACAIEPGDRVTIDQTASVPYAGEYEVLDPKTVKVPAAQVEGSNGSIQRAADAGSGEIAFVLGPYDESIFYDESDDLAAGYPSVPGSDPGNNNNYTSIDLAGGGVFVFFTGLGDSGTQFQLPSSGFPSGNLLAWAGPAGSNVLYHSMRVIERCEADANRNLILIYNDDEGTTWGGPVGYAAVAWLSADTTFVSGGMTWIEFTLLGGEKIIFGFGIFADGAAISLPAGYSLADAFAVAFPHDTPTDTTHNPRIVGANVDSSGVVHFVYNDGAGNTWTGKAAVFVFAWKNNMGTVVTETVGTTKWMKVTLSNGKKFGMGCALNVPDGGSLDLPADAGSATTLQVMAGTSTFAVPAGAGHTWGVDSCYVDTDNVVHITFGSTGNFVPGVADVLALYCEPGADIPTLVSITPASTTLPAGATQQYAAVVSGNANPNVIWKVDGIIGGNISVGTISAIGFYSAPSAAGSHTITAVSVADPSAEASATVNVFGAILTGDVLTDDFGNIVYSDGGDTIVA